MALLPFIASRRSFAWNRRRISASRGDHSLHEGFGRARNVSDGDVRTRRTANARAPGAALARVGYGRAAYLCQAGELCR